MWAVAGDTDEICQPMGGDGHACCENRIPACDYPVTATARQMRTAFETDGGDFD
jgi:hypothetical protein